MLEYKCLYMIFYDASCVRLLCLLWWSEAELFCVSAVFTNETEAELERDVYWVSFFRRAFIQFLPLLNRTTGIISIIWSWLRSHLICVVNSSSEYEDHIEDYNCGFQDIKLLLDIMSFSRMED